MVYFVVCEFHLSKNTPEKKDSHVHCPMMITMTILMKEKTLEVNRDVPVPVQCCGFDPRGCLFPSHGAPSCYVGKRRELPFTECKLAVYVGSFK